MIINRFSVEAVELVRLDRDVCKFLGCEQASLLKISPVEVHEYSHACALKKEACFLSHVNGKQ